CARGRLLRQERIASLAHVEHDGPRFEEDEAVFLEDRHLPEGLERAIARGVLIALLEEPSPVGQLGLLERPAHAQIADLAARQVGNPFESGNRDHAVPPFMISSNETPADRHPGRAWQDRPPRWRDWKDAPGDIASYRAT